jgi:hypothetical protein
MSSKIYFFFWGGGSLTGKDVIFVLACPSALIVKILQLYFICFLLDIRPKLAQQGYKQFKNLVTIKASQDQRFTKKSWKCYKKAFLEENAYQAKTLCLYFHPWGS